MYYSAGVAGLASFGATQALPDDGPLWLLARLLLDGAGCLFGLYLLAGLGLALVGQFIHDDAPQVAELPPGGPERPSR